VASEYGALDGKIDFPGPRERTEPFMTPQQFEKAQKRVPTRFGTIACFEQGSGPDALFLHGLPLCSYQWRDVIERIAPNRRCIAPDLMGLGYSEVPADQDVSFASQASMVACMLDVLEIEKIDLVGSDTGGGIAQIFAATHPSRVRSLTLANCEVFDLWPNELLTGFYKAVVAGDISAAMRVMLTDTAFGQQQLGALVYENVATFSTGNIQLYLEPLLASEKRIEQFKKLADWAGNRSQLMAVAPQLKASKIPSQVIWGDGDVVFDTAPSLAWLREHLGGLQQITVIPGAKLFFPEEHAARMASMLLQFWSMTANPA
jgi:pimeloyl-ACP methyl ester carboxylesterase